MERRDRLAELLTDDDVETLKHLAREGMGENSLRALASDLAYLEAWAQAATGAALPWPASESLALKFVAHHLWDPARRETDPAAWHAGRRRGAAARSALLLRSDGPHAPSTVKRRLASWGTLHRWKGQEGPFRSPSLRAALRLAVRASTRPRQRKSKRAVTRDVLDRLLAHLPVGPARRYPRSRHPAPRVRLRRATAQRGSAAAGRAAQRRAAGPARSPGPEIRRRCRAWPFSSAAPRPATPTRRAGCCWSGRRSRRCANGSNGPTSARGRSSAPSTAGRRSRRGR